MNQKRRLTHYYRDSKQGLYSIEQVFASLNDKISESYELTDFYCNSDQWRLNQILQASKNQGDVNHITGDVHFLAAGLSPGKTILTIHDLYDYQFNLHGLKKQLFKTLWIDIPINRAKFITTVSSYYRDKLLELTGCSEDKVKVIHNPASKDLFYSPKEFNLEKPSILQIGAGSNKNASRLIEAVRGISCKIIFIRSILDIDLVDKLLKYKIDFEWHSQITRQQVIDLYLKTDILFFGSTMEGFGLPILEANCIGRPVITSNTTSMPEVAGEAALLIDPYSIDEIRDAIIRITNDSKLRNSLVENGKDNCKKFNSNIIAEKYCSLYSTLLES